MFARVAERFVVVNEVVAFAFPLMNRVVFADPTFEFVIKIPTVKVPDTFAFVEITLFVSNCIEYRFPGTYKGGGLVVPIPTLEFMERRFMVVMLARVPIRLVVWIPFDA